MNFTHVRVDMEKTLARGEPVADLPRSVGETWLVVNSQAEDFDKPIDWRRSIRGNVVPVPLIPYAMPTDLDIALGFMVQMGARIALSVGAPVSRLHLAIGNPVSEEQLADDGGTYWRYWLGFAVLLQR